MNTLRAHLDHITALDFLDSGRQLCSSDQQGWTIWWSLETRRPLSIWKSHDESIISTKCRDNLVYTHGRDNLLRVWRLEPSDFFATSPPTSSSDPNAYPHPWMIHQQDINALNFCSISVKGNIFATPSTLSSDKIDIYSLTPFDRPVKALAPEIFESDMATEPTKLGIVMTIRLYDDYIVIGYESGHVAVYSAGVLTSADTDSILMEPQLEFIQQVHKDPLQSFTRVGSYIFSGASDRTLARINVNDWSCIKVKVPKKGIPTVTHLDDAVVTAGWDDYVRLFDLELKPKGSFKDIRNVSCLAISTVKPARAKRLKPLPQAFMAVAGKDARISLHEINNGQIMGPVLRTISMPRA